MPVTKLTVITPHYRQFADQLSTALAISVKEVRRSEIKRIIEAFIKDDKTSYEEREFIATMWGVNKNVMMKLALTNQLR